MITSEFFIGLVFVDVAFILYTFLDIDNRIYGNIITSALSSVLSFILSAKLVARDVIYKAPDQLMIYSYSNTTLEEFPSGEFTHTDFLYQQIDYFFETRSISLFFLAIGVVMAIVTILFIVDEILKNTKEI